MLLQCIYIFMCHAMIIGDWHTAYILIYGPQRLEILPTQ